MGTRRAGAAAVGGQPDSAAVREHSERGARRQGWMAERQSASECSGRGPARAGQGGNGLLEHRDAKIHSQKSSARNFQLKNMADCEIMFQITKNTVFNKNNLNSFMNPFYFKSLFYCLLMLQFSSSTFY